MNYRHAFHAGGHADVLKHVVLAAMIERLKGKATPFRVLDTHAGIRVYDLASDAAGRTGEWRDGVGRLYDANGAARLQLETARTNVVGQSLYESCGWKRDELFYVYAKGLRD